jgi:hypothetical protein
MRTGSLIPSPCSSWPCWRSSAPGLGWLPPPRIRGRTDQRGVGSSQLSHGRVYGFQTPERRGSRGLGFTPAVAFDYATFPQGWVGFAPLSIPNELDAVYRVDVRGTASAFAASAIRFVKKFYFHAGVTESLQAANGFMVTTIGPQCTNGECKEALVITNGPAVWELAAFSRAPVSAVESFIDSFQPIR